MEEIWREKWESGKKVYIDTKVGRGVEKGAKEDERQEADRAEEFLGKKGRVEVEKGENDKEQRRGRRERKRSNGGG